MIVKELPEPIDPDASFCTTCPYCHEAGNLYVESGSFDCSGMHLGELGFSTLEASTFNTSDEMVNCRACGKCFPLSEVTR